MSDQAAPEKTTKRKKGSSSTPQLAAAAPSTEQPADTNGSAPVKVSKQSQIKQLTSDLAAAREQISKLTKQNEDLLDELETLKSVLSVHAQQKLETTKKRAKKQIGVPVDDGEGEFDDDDDNTVETFNKQAASDDTSIKKYASGHNRAKSVTAAPSIPADATAKSGDLLNVSLPATRQSKSPSRKPAASAGAINSTGDTIAESSPTESSPAKQARPTRPVASNPRKPKYNTASNLTKTIISKEDETELLGVGEVPDRKKIIESLTLVAGPISPGQSPSNSPVVPPGAATAPSRPSVDSKRVSNPSSSSAKSPPSSLNTSNSTLSSSAGSDPARAATPPTSSADDHPQIFDENTVLDILCGLGITSSRQFEDDELSTLTPKDYSYSYQFKVRRTSDQLLKFKDFAPKVFHQIRKHFNVSEAELLFSFRYDNLDAFPGAGKSGAFFIFTRDRRFILKTATKEERDFLWEMLPYYLKHIRKNPNTLLPRFYGVYSMKHEGIGGVVRFVIMNNWFSSVYDPVEKYDLKGSTVGRTVGETQKSGSILKDLDIKRKFYFPGDLRQQIAAQLKRDSEFLSTHNVMDYSLLVGVYYDTGDKAQRDAIAKRREGRKKDREDYSFKSIYQGYENGTKAHNYEADREEIYFCGIIDVLQRYNAAKKFEHFLKSIPYKSGEISIVAPSYYSKRFYEFVSDKFTDDKPPQLERELATSDSAAAKKRAKKSSKTESRDTRAESRDALSTSKKRANDETDEEDSRSRSHTVV